MEDSDVHLAEKSSNDKKVNCDTGLTRTYNKYIVKGNVDVISIDPLYEECFVRLQQYPLTYLFV